MHLACFVIWFDCFKFKHHFRNKTSNLNEEELSFLFANSIASRGDGLSLINHPEKSQELNHLVVDKPSSNLKLIGTYGSKVCSLTKTDKFESEVKICPWHYEIEHRSDRLVWICNFFPFSYFIYFFFKIHLKISKNKIKCEMQLRRLLGKNSFWQ